MTESEYAGLDEEPLKKSLFDNKVILERSIALVDPKPTDFLLDIGKNAGSTALAFCSKVSKVVAIDQRVSTTQKLRDKIEKRGISNIEVIGPFNLEEDIPFESDSFDIVTSRAIVNQVEDVKKFFDEIYRALKPNGRLDVWVPIFSEDIKDLWTSLSKVYDESHKTDFTYLEIVHTLSSSGFEISYMSPFSVPRNLSEKLRRVEDDILRKRIQDVLLWNKERLAELKFRWVDDPDELKKLKVEDGRPHWFHNFNTLEILAIKK